jgi:hypothetical protein
MRWTVALTTVILAGSAAGCGSSGKPDHPVAEQLPKAPKLVVNAYGWTISQEEVSFGGYVTNDADLDAEIVTAHVSIVGKGGRVLLRGAPLVGDIPAHAKGRPFGGHMFLAGGVTAAQVDKLKIALTADGGAPHANRFQHYRLVDRHFDVIDGRRDFGGRLRNDGKGSMGVNTTVDIVYEDAAGHILGGDIGRSDLDVPPGQSTLVTWDSFLPKGAKRIFWAVAFGNPPK